MEGGWVGWGDGGGRWAHTPALTGATAGGPQGTPSPLHPWKAGAWPPGRCNHLWQWWEAGEACEGEACAAERGRGWAKTTPSCPAQAGRQADGRCREPRTAITSHATAWLGSEGHAPTMPVQPAVAKGVPMPPTFIYLTIEINESPQPTNQPTSQSMNPPISSPISFTMAAQAGEAAATRDSTSCAAATLSWSTGQGWWWLGRLCERGREHMTRGEDEQWWLGRVRNNHMAALLGWASHRSHSTPTLPSPPFPSTHLRKRKPRWPVCWPRARRARGCRFSGRRSTQGDAGGGEGGGGGVAGSHQAQAQMTRAGLRACAASTSQRHRFPSL